jgi:hypothetical protein
MHHAILRHGARSFFLAYGEDYDEGLDQAMGTKVDHRTNLLKKPCEVALELLSVPAFGVLTWIFASVLVIARRLEFF